MKTILPIVLLALYSIGTLSAEEYVLEKHMVKGYTAFFKLLAENDSDELPEGIPSIEEYAEKTVEVWKKDFVYSKSAIAKLNNNQPIRTQQAFKKHIVKFLPAQKHAKTRKKFFSYFSNKQIPEAEKEVVYLLLIYVVPPDEK